METVVVVDVVVVVVVGLPSLQLIKQAGVLKFIVCCAPEDGPFVNSGRVWERRRSVCPLCVRPHASVCVCVRLRISMYLCYVCMYTYACVRICLSVYQPTYPSIYLPISLSLTICLCVSMPVCVCVYSCVHPCACIVGRRCLRLCQRRQAGSLGRFLEGSRPSALIKALLIC